MAANIRPGRNYKFCYRLEKKRRRASCETRKKNNATNPTKIIIIHREHAFLSREEYQNGNKIPRNISNIGEKQKKMNTIHSVEEKKTNYNNKIMGFSLVDSRFSTQFVGLLVNSAQCVMLLSSSQVRIDNQNWQNTHSFTVKQSTATTRCHRMARETFSFFFFFIPFIHVFIAEPVALFIMYQFQSK